ncbi:MAG: hypothetical protein B7Y80_17240 [Hyphomicrobium sp. 32-62-53]|nr:MAG: hypothetical protein B7Y80_17240 [Hyphomicrobium sp. 32-62-53]
MWDKPENLTVSALARPLRIAYLVDVGDCPNALLDAIFAEAYGRWGGRRTLIVPATAQGTDPRYADWLDYFDADILYSFVALDDASVARIHERYGPAHLVRHREFQRDPTRERSFRIELPVNGLSSLSVLPVFRGRTWGFDGPPLDVKVLSKHWDRSASPFLEENFGFLSKTFANGMIGRTHPDVFTCTTLITEKSLEDRREGTDPKATHLTSEADVLTALAAPGGALTLAQLSDWFCPWLDTGDGISEPGTSIVVGDTVPDRLLFWNMHHRFGRPAFSEIAVLRIPPERAADDEFLDQIKALIRHRGVRGHNNHNDHISLRSCSLDPEALEALAVRLRQGKHYLGVSVCRVADHAAVVPRFRNPDRVMFHTGGVFAEPPAEASAEFNGKRVPVPTVMPWHMKEGLPPPGLRNGQWMVDLTINRYQDHGRYANQRDVWVLPRRLRLERAVTVNRERERSFDSEDPALRVTRSGQLALAMSTGVSRAAVTMPDDLDAIRMAVCCNQEWLLFDRDRKDGPIAQPRFALAEVSDKGRYLIGVLGLFDTLADAFGVLMNGFWREELQCLGGVPAEKADAARARLIKRLRRLLGRPDGPLHFSTEEEIARLARESLRAGRMLSREATHVHYKKLKERWSAVAEAFLSAHPRTGQDDDHYRDEDWLSRSVQFLCQREVLFQGRDWRCRSCFNRNWVGIDTLTRTMTCAVCRREEPAPVGGDWQFRPNPFLVEAYRDHGTEALVWALWQLWDSSRRSFYYAPSLRLWREYPKGTRGTADVEVDAIAIVDGRVHLIEAKSASGLDSAEIKKLVIAAGRIRPDVLVIACMDAPTDALHRAAGALRESLPEGIVVEVMTFKSEHLDRSPLLPS